MVTELTRRQQIESTASVLFRERGYAATSIRDIARALDMQGASLYAHVASKEDVLWSIVSRAADRFDAAVSPIAVDATRVPTDALAEMIRAHIRVITEDQGNAASFLQEWRFLSAVRRADINNRRDRYEQRFRDLIQRGIRSGDFERTTDPHVAATLILSALNGVATWYRVGGQLTPDQIADRYTSLLIGGLRAGGQEAAYPEPTPTGRTLR